MMTLQQFSLKPETVPASTSWYLADLSEARGKQELFTRQTPQRLKVLREHALIESAVSALAAFNLDFLCIHPFRDGNGRVSRLLLLLQCYHLGFEVGRYISLERLIEQNKDRYYETLEQSSQRWHERRHDPWPYLNYALFILKSAYREFEERLGQIKSPRGAKTEMVDAAVNAFSGSFTLAELERACPGISRDMVRRVLRDLQKAGKVECLGRGPGAAWRKRGNIHKRG